MVDKGWGISFEKKKKKNGNEKGYYERNNDRIVLIQSYGKQEKKKKKKKKNKNKQTKAFRGGKQYLGVEGGAWGSQEGGGARHAERFR